MTNSKGKSGISSTKALDIDNNNLSEATKTTHDTMAGCYASTDIERLQKAMRKIVVSNTKMLESSKAMRESMQNALQPMLEAQKRMIEATIPMRELQETLSKSVAFNVGAQVKLSFPNCFGEIIAENKRSIARSANLIEAMQRVIPKYRFDITPALTLPIQQLLQGIKIDYVERFKELFKDFDFHSFFDKFNHIVICEAYDARWFPHAVWNADQKLVYKVLDVVNATRKSKNRIIRIDKLIFDYYSKAKIEDIRKSWRNMNVPSFKVRMMNQAVQAYHRREFAITVVVLSTLWEGIIYEKLKDNRRKNGKRTKENFEILIEDNQYDEIFNSFFSEYIMYDCKSVEEIKDDVPGRNSIAHGWYDKYPTKKAALNAILFTDFLLRLEPVDKEKQDSKALKGEGED